MIEYVAYFISKFILLYLTFKTIYVSLDIFQNIQLYNFT